MSTVQLWIPGHPVPKGSKRAFVRGGRAMMIEDNERTRPWMSSITVAARDAGTRPLEGPVAVGLRFWVVRPKGHYSPKGLLRPTAPAWPAVKPDLDKLTRAVLDALNGVAFLDDAQVVGLYPAPWKCYAGSRGPGLELLVQPLPGDPAMMLTPLEPFEPLGEKALDALVRSVGP